MAASDSRPRRPRWDATPFQTIVFVFAGLIVFGNVARILSPAVRAATPLPEGVATLAPPWALFLSVQCVGLERARRPRYPRPLALIVGLIVAADAALLALALAGVLAEVPALALLLTACTYVACAIANAIRAADERAAARSGAG